MGENITPFQITSEIVSTVTAVAESIGRLEGLNLTRPSPQLRRKNRIQSIQASLAIEGNSLTTDQVTALLDKKRVVGPSQDIWEVQNAISAYDRLSGFKPLEMDSLLKAHAIMMKGLVPEPGAFRRGSIGVLRKNNILHEAPPGQKVVPMMQALFEYLRESDDHILIKSCCFHFQLEHIHPFSDGNGRMGRFWQTRFLMLYHPVFEFLPMEHLIHRRQQAYYDALTIGDDTGDCTAFIVFSLAQLKEALKQLAEETRGVTLTPEKRIDIAQANLGKGMFSRNAYQNLLKTISTATASRDLNQGVRTGRLIRAGDKRTSVYRFKALKK
jgi:Fic family protein